MGLVGFVGEVIHPIPADGLGEVELMVGQCRPIYLARSEEPLEIGTKVLVIDETSKDVPTVIVEPWDLERKTDVVLRNPSA